MAGLPTWVAYLQALSTPMIALIVAFIAYRQWRTAHSKLVLDLFERRLSVYRQVRSAVGVVNTTGKVTREAEIDLLQAMESAEFLFGKDVQNYLQDMWNRFIKLNAANHMIANGTQEQRQSNARAQGDLFDKITNFYYEGADVFSPYMKMDHRVRPVVKRKRQRPSAPAATPPSQDS